MAELTSPRSAAHRVLAATSVSYTVVLLDASIVNVALEQIGYTFGSNIAGLQWVINAYTLTFASLLMTGGTLGDRLGSRDVYLAGLAVFTLASALCGLTPSLPMLTFARALQGVGSAMLVPCSLALINHAYPVPSERAAAVSVWMGCGGVAMASGPLVGGLLIHLVGWRSIFFVNVPIGLVGLWLTLSVDRTASSRTQYFDLPGQIAAIVALGTLIGVLIEGPVLGWQSVPILASIATSCIAWIAFFVIEASTATPMLPIQFFRNELFSGSTFVSMASAFVFYGMLFTFSLYYQQVRDYSALFTGLAFLPMTGMVALGGLLSSRLVKLLGSRQSMCIAFGLYAAGALGMMRSSASSPYWIAIVPMLAIGLASGFISPAATSPALGTVEKNRAGIAAAVLNSARQSGAALGVAIFGTFISTLYPFQRAMSLILGVVIALSLVAAIVWWVTSHAATANVPRATCPSGRGADDRPRC
ncbi:MFS transporter [Paraburkholderia sp. Ac-20347]|uniref:MFS transporter n=1 Tax=Paraburkholderia sp. Ac-20347 TaxID=2703892 RepID=UPI00197F9BA7|nr:MFS transporter [Paraburkholderia sp. Ac-20347]MBN3809961.1 MFS transporter [Paraburkholderia sp. Ac-20347]